MTKSFPYIFEKKFKNVNKNQVPPPKKSLVRNLAYSMTLLLLMSISSCTKVDKPILGSFRTSQSVSLTPTVLKNSMFPKGVLQFSSKKSFSEFYKKSMLDSSILKSLPKGFVNFKTYQNNFKSTKANRKSQQN